MYWSGSCGEMLLSMQRAKAAGAVGVILTLDWSFTHGRDWGSPTIPERRDYKAMLRFVPDALFHTRWLRALAQGRQLPDMTVANMVVGHASAPSFFEAYRRWVQTPPPTWQDVAWFVRSGTAR
jgi:pre-mycofactocin synthase